MGIIDSLRDIYDYKHTMSENGTQISVMTHLEPAGFVELAKKLLMTKESYPRFDYQFAATLCFPSQPDSVTISFSPSMAKVEVDDIQPEARELLDIHADLTSIARLIRIYLDDEVCSPSGFIGEVKNNLEELSSRGFSWDVTVSVSKRPFEEFLKDQLTLAGLNAGIILFVTSKGLEEYLKEGNHMYLYDRAYSDSGHLVVAVGDWENPVSGRHLALVNLWKFENEILALKDCFSEPDRLQSNHEFLLTVASPGIGSMLAVPSFFELDRSPQLEPNQKIIELMDTLEVFNVLLVVPSYASMNKQNGEWDLRIIGNKTLQANLALINGKIYIDGDALSLAVKPLIEFYHWIVDDRNQARFSLARRSITLQASSFREFVQQPRQIQMSAEAAFNLWIDQAVAEVLEINQRFTEYFLDWTNRDTELKLKLHGVVNDTALGGFGTILGTIVGLAVQSFEPTAARVALFVIPIAFMIYLALRAVSVEQIYGFFNTYLEQHTRQLRYYKRILGEKAIEEVAGEESPDELRKGFRRNRCLYQMALAALCIIAFVFWLSLLANGYFTE